MPIANDVLPISDLRFFGVIFIESPASSFSKTGKSSLGNVARLYFPEFVSILKLSPSRKKCISEPSLKSLQSSLSFFAGAVVLPPLLKFDIVDIVEISDSKSVAVSLKDDSSTSNKTLARIGSVCLFSTTPNVELSDFTTSSFVI